MFGYILLALYLMAGVALTDAIFYRQDRVIRLWLGLCAGLILMMWLPTLYAFFLRFTRAAQLLGLGTAIALAALAHRLNATSAINMIAASLATRVFTPLSSNSTVFIRNRFLFYITPGGLFKFLAAFAKYRLEMYTYRNIDEIYRNILETCGNIG